MTASLVIVLSVGDAPVVFADHNTSHVVATLIATRQLHARHVMIDPSRETLLSFAELARRIPPSRRGRPVHVSTVWRWAVRGVRGVRLETLRLPSRHVTSEEAFARFTGALTRDSTESPRDEHPRKRPATANSDATRALDALGY